MNQPESDNEARWTTFGAVAAAAGAAVCCLGPVLAVSLGATGAWIGQMSALEAYRPLFMAVAAGCLGWGFYRVYGARARADADCADDCEVPRASRYNEVGLWVATVVVAALFASPYLLSLGATNARASADRAATSAEARSPTEAASATPARNDSKRIELTVDGMTCQGCARTIGSTLDEMDGVREAKVSFKPPRARVDVDPDRVSAQDVVEAVEDLGYSVTRQK